MTKHCTQCGEPQPDDARFCPKCGAAAIPPGSDPMVGKVVADRYLIVDKVGQGTSGTIYRAEHTTLRKKVAVKILHTQLSQDENAIERFRREATTVGQIDNEHIVQVLDFGRTEDKRLFFAMEFLDGETLKAVIDRDGKLAIPRVVDILTQIGEALTEAHGLGYIHRDLRPRNVFLITRKGRADFVKLLDFGLSKLVVPNADRKQTALGMTFGDPRYMSPEQARGDQIDRRADIYALGCIAYEMLTGAPVFAAKSPFEVLQKHLDVPAPKVRAMRPDCPVWLEEIVDRALQKRPDDRFVTVLRLVEHLKAEKAPVATEIEAEQARERATETAQIKAAPSQTQAFGTIERRPAPAAVSTGPGATAAQTKAPQPDAAATLPARPKKGDQKRKGPRSNEPPITRSGEMNAAPPASATTKPSGPTVVVEGGADDDSVTRPLPTVAAKPVPPTAPTPATGSPAAKPRGDQTDPAGSWFDESSAFQKSDGLIGAYDDEDDPELRKKNRMPIVIGAAAGGLMLAATLALALWPKPPKKPLRGEVASAESAAPSPSTQASPTTASTTTPPATPPPAEAPTPPTPATTTPVAVAAAAPTPEAKAEPAKSEAPKAEPPKAEAPKPEVAKAEAPKAPKAEAPKPEIAKPEIAKPEIAKPEIAKPEIAKAESKREPAKPASPTVKVASVAPAPTPAKDPSKPSTKSSGKLPDGFKDPFDPKATKPTPTAPSAVDAAQAEFFVKLGRQKLGSGDTSAAATHFNKARELDARNADALAGLGEVAFEQGEYDSAASYLKQALRLSPSRARIVTLLGQSYYKLGRTKDAIAEYKRALRLDPNNAEAQRSLELAEKKLASGG
jgi:serine/threonine protein kinase